ncbi:hypothetical protein B0H21DRAFT_821900 [Amylocystis lapponica]|nr:hypothetical protein B0H21DRAFT_821900 [Amylocystis lapponica]
MFMLQTGPWLDDVLIVPAHSISKQKHDLNGHYLPNFKELEGPRSALYKELFQLLLDPSYKSIRANTTALTLFTHIRAASEGSAITGLSVPIRPMVVHT